MAEACDLPGTADISASSVLKVRIAGITWEIFSADPTLVPDLEGALKVFRIPAGIPDIRIRASWDPMPAVRCPRMLFESGGLWQLYLDDSLYRYEFISPIFGPAPYMVAVFQPDFTAGTVFLHRGFFDARKPVYPLHYPLDELLMMNLLAAGAGIEIHACGLFDAEGIGRLFVGESGAGKTTMARLWAPMPGIRILSDDRIILRRLAGRIWMYGTPWHGEAALADPDRAPLHRIYFLHHGRHNQLMPKAGAEAVALLFRSTFPPFYSPDGLAFGLAFCEEVARSVPSFDLESVPDGRLIEFLQGNP